jgi:malonyl-CoA/methylmalonyl-CoA synthetase
MNPLADLLLSTARRNPDRPLLRTPAGEIWAHGDLERRSAALAHVLVSRGVQPSDRVVVQLGKSADVVALHVAVVRVGAVYVPLNMAYTDTELAGLLEDADPALVVRDARPDGSFAHASLEDLLQEGSRRPGHFADVARSESDPAAMLYTSGTTGRPKGAVMSQGNLVLSATTLASAWGFTEDDVLLHMLPLYHTHGLFVAVYCAVASGGSMILLDEFSPDAVIRDLPGCTVMMGVPTHYTRLLARPDFTADVTRGVRLFTSGSAPMLTTTHEQFEQRTGQVILERYGMTETCMLTSNPLTSVRKPGTVGLPLPGVDVRLTDGTPGGIEVRGPNVFSGYWRRPELTDTEFTADGWFRTGDLGRFDADGYLEIVGRSKDLVITGGLNVYPKEVEYVLDSLPGVLESAVVGLPDADFGESVTAAVIAEPGVELDPEGLRLLAREQLAAFKVPKRILLLEHLPRNAMGKVEKARLRDVLPTMIGR